MGWLIFWLACAALWFELCDRAPERHDMEE